MKFTPTRSEREIWPGSSPVFGLPPAIAAGPSAAATTSTSAPSVISATPLICVPFLEWGSEWNPFTEPFGF